MNRLKEVRTIEKKKIDFRLEVKSIPNEDKAVVYLYGDIVDERPTDWCGGEVEGDFIIPKDVREIIDGIAEENIELHINSYGGSVFASVAIFNFLKASGKNITAYNDGICASGASLILMSGDKIVMPANTMLMIHRASAFGWGNCKDLRSVAETLEKLDNSTVLETYKFRFKGSDEDLMNLIDFETWISAKEALEYGLCDEVIELSPPKVEESQEEITNKGINFMRNFANLKLKEFY